MRSKDQTGRDGHGKSVVTDPLGIPVMFNLKCLIKLTQKKKMSCEIFADFKTSNDKSPSLF